MCGDNSARARGDAAKAQANEQYKLRNFDKALQLYDEAIQLNPQEILYHNNKAAVYLELEQYDKCLEVCNTALEKRYEMKAQFESVAKVYNRLAVCYIRMSHYDNAVQMYEKSVTEHNTRATRQLLNETIKLRDKAAQQAYINPEKAGEHRVKGNEFFKQQKYPEAKKEYDEAIRRDPNDHKLYSNRAAAFTKLGAYPSAITDCDRALEIKPDFIKAITRKGNIYIMSKEHHKALECFSKGLTIDPQNAECITGRANVMAAIQSMQGGTPVDKEQIEHNLADPQIQALIRDPQIAMVLQDIQDNPASLTNYMSDPKISSAISQLVAAGVLRMA